MERLKFIRNLIVAIVGLFIVFFILNIVKDHSDEVVPKDDVESIPSDVDDKGEMSLVSEKGVEIFVSDPKTDVKVTNPIHISGRAPGNWFFEANMPVTLTNWDGLIIAEGHVNAVGEWMTTDYVPFEGNLEFAKPDYGENGYLILRKDNPSDNPEFDDSVEMTVKLN
jgi:hypothetical protein